MKQLSNAQLFAQIITLLTAIDGNTDELELKADTVILNVDALEELMRAQGTSKIYQKIMNADDMAATYTNVDVGEVSQRITVSEIVGTIDVVAADGTVTPTVKTATDTFTFDIQFPASESIADGDIDEALNQMTTAQAWENGGEVTLAGTNLTLPVDANYFVGVLSSTLIALYPSAVDAFNNTNRETITKAGSATAVLTRLSRGFFATNGSTRVIS